MAIDERRILLMGSADYPTHRVGKASAAAPSRWTGYGDRILLSHDAGWYRPGETNGGTQKPYTYLIDTFIPKLGDVGVDEGTIRMITQMNPVRAFGFKSDE